MCGYQTQTELQQLTHGSNPKHDHVLTVLKRLRLVSTRLAAATSGLELAALGAHVRLDMRVWDTWRTKVLNGFPAVLGAAQKHAIGPGGRPQCQLVKRDDLTSGLHHSEPGLCRVGG